MGPARSRESGERLSCRVGFVIRFGGGGRHRSRAHEFFDQAQPLGEILSAAISAAQTKEGEHE